MTLICQKHRFESSSELELSSLSYRNYLVRRDGWRYAFPFVLPFFASQEERIHGRQFIVLSTDFKIGNRKRREILDQDSLDQLHIAYSDRRCHQLVETKIGHIMILSAKNDLVVI